MKRYKCPKCGSGNVWRDAAKHLNTGEVVEQDSTSCQDCGYEKDYGFETDADETPGSREVVLMVAYHGPLSDSVVLEKARLFTESQITDYMRGPEHHVLAGKIVAIGYRAGFRDAERAYRLGSAVPADADPSRTLFSVLI